MELWLSGYLAIWHCGKGEPWDRGTVGPWDYENTANGLPKGGKGNTRHNVSKAPHAEK